MMHKFSYLEKKLWEIDLPDAEMMKGKQNKCVSRIPLPNWNLKVSKAIQEFLDFTIVNLCDNSESLTSS